MMATLLIAPRPTRKPQDDIRERPLPVAKDFRDRITTIEPDHFILPLVAGEAATDQMIIDCAALGMFVRALRGRKMRTLNDLYDEFSAACQFPLYFGENLMSFDECLSSLDNQDLGKGIVLAIVEPDQVLLDSVEAELELFLSCLINAASEWGEKIDSGEWWDRPAIPFHVILAGSQEQLDSCTAKWRSAKDGLRIDFS